MDHEHPRIQLLQEHCDTMRREVRVWFPEEACGFLAGIGFEVMRVIPVTNILHSATRYRMHPQEQLAAMLQMEADGQSVVGIYHSHPKGPSGLSALDLRQAAYPDAAYLVWSKPQSTWQCRAFQIVDHQSFAIELRVEHKAT